MRLIVDQSAGVCKQQCVIFNRVLVAIGGEGPRHLIAGCICRGYIKGIKFI